MSENNVEIKLKEVLLKLFENQTRWSLFKNTMFTMAKEEQEKGKDISLFHRIINLMFAIETDERGNEDNT